MSIDILKLEALKLDKIERLQFVQFILESLAQEERSAMADAALNESQKQEIDRRRQSLHEGAPTYSWEEVKAYILDNHGA